MGLKLPGEEQSGQRSSKGEGLGLGMSWVRLEDRKEARSEKVGKKGWSDRQGPFMPWKGCLILFQMQWETNEGFSAEAPHSLRMVSFFGPPAGIWSSQARV